MHRTALLTLLTALLAAGSLAGCGQTGPLYLPDRSAEPVPQASPAAPERSEDSHRKIH